MSTEPQSSAKVLRPDSPIGKLMEPDFSRPQPSGVIPPELLPYRYIATQLHSHIATEHISSGGEGEMLQFLPTTQEDHSSVWDGLGNCLWRLCRRIRALKDGSASINSENADLVFERWYETYRKWCETVSVTAEPKSRLHGEFLAALEKCKLAEGETVVQYAFNVAKEGPPPPETASFADDSGMCMLASTLRECALFNDEGGVCYASTRDIEKYTNLCTKDTASRWLKQLERRNILLKISSGMNGATNGKAQLFVYLPLADLDKMSPKNRSLYKAALSKKG